MPIINANFVVLDTELTGLDETKDSIISIAGIKMVGKRIKIADCSYNFLAPSCKMNRENILIHGLVPSELEGYTDKKQILRSFLSFLEDSIIVGHFIIIDLAFLKKEVRQHLNISFNPLTIEILFIYRWLIDIKVLPEEFRVNTSLVDIAQSLGIEVKELHNALNDAFITAQIFQRFISYLATVKVFTIDSLLKIGKPIVSGYIGLKQQKQHIY
ncbi:MAG: 3'-5' exonuclease [Thermodesulfovibrionales bacterium]|nr:3'-5' exonuclease [Thermodesulfovibrionales bacterium]